VPFPSDPRLTGLFKHGTGGKGVNGGASRCRRRGPPAGPGKRTGAHSGPARGTENPPPAGPPDRGAPARGPSPVLAREYQGGAVSRVRRSLAAGEPFGAAGLSSAGPPVWPGTRGPAVAQAADPFARGGGDRGAPLCFREVARPTLAGPAPPVADRWAPAGSAPALRPVAGTPGPGHSCLGTFAARWRCLPGPRYLLRLCFDGISYEGGRKTGARPDRESKARPKKVTAALMGGGGTGGGDHAQQQGLSPAAGGRVSKDKDPGRVGGLALGGGGNEGGGSSGSGWTEGTWTRRGTGRVQGVQGRPGNRQGGRAARARTTSNFRAWGRGFKSIRRRCS